MQAGVRAPTLPVIMWSGLYARPAQPQPVVRVILSEAEVLFIKQGRAFVLLGSTTGVVPIDDLLVTSATPRL